MIWDLLPKNDGLTLRRTCKDLYFRTAPRIFTELVFRLCKADIDMLDHLANKIEYANSIRSLSYFWADLPRLSAVQLKQDIRNAKVRSNYSNASHEMAALARAQSDLACLKRILPKLSKLEEFCVESASHPKMNTTSFPSYKDRKTLGQREFDVVLKAILHSPRDVKALCTWGLNWRYFRRGTKPMLCKAKRQLASLTRFACVLDNGTDEYNDHFGYETATCLKNMSKKLLKNFISSLPNLEDLSVGFAHRDDNHEGQFPASISSILADHTWPCLRTLAIQNIECSGEELMAVLSRHRYTLRELSLYSIILRSTSWVVLLCQIRKTLDLRSARIGGDLYGKLEDAEEKLWRTDDHEEILKRVDRWCCRQGPDTPCPLLDLSTEDDES